MKSIFILIAALLYTISIYSQVAPNKYCIEFTDKNNNGYSLDAPEEFLSEKALQRRANQGIALNEADLPVNQEYIDSLSSLGLQILNVSKWFNLVTVYTLDSLLMDTIQNLSFVSNKRNHYPTPYPKGRTVPVPTKYKKYRTNNIYSNNTSSDYYDYGNSSTQIKMHNAHKLHNSGYRGKGMLIAVTDAGFTGFPNLPSFDSLYNENRVLATRNFVHGGDTVYNHSTHGMRVLSILSANYPGNLIGSAPEASYLLLMSEDPATEYIIEELNWITAAEFADSMGADLINVSLGYVDFDDSTSNHTYSELDGEQTPISIAARMASETGMLVVIAAANSGNDEEHPWIAAPGDAKKIITAGAVWADETYASFSSIGPSYDGRIKPDLVAMGGGTFNQETSGDIGTGNGTSFATPLLTGMIACLWQKYPQKTNMEIIEAIRKSGHLYNNPTVYLGYGIPDFEIADIILGKENIKIENDFFNMYPNPFIDEFKIQLKNKVGDSIEVTINDISGKTTHFWFRHDAVQNNTLLTINEIKNFKQGIYILTVKINNKRKSIRIVKTN